jgi:hypothetical protein
MSVNITKSSVLIDPFVFKTELWDVGAVKEEVKQGVTVQEHKELQEE